MAGFALAILGGAMEGWGKGQLEDIKAKREEKLHMLDQQFAREQGELTRGLQREQIAATTQLAREQRASTEALTKMEIGSREKIAQAGNISQEQIAASNLRMQEHLQTLQTQGAKDIAQLQADTQKQIGSTFVQMEDNSWKLKIGDKLQDLGNDPVTGKPMVPMVTDGDTNELKNYKALLATGLSKEQARSMAFDKDTDPAKLETDILKALIAGRGDFAPPATEDDTLNYGKLAKRLAEGITGAGGEPTSAAETTDPNQIVIPREWTDEQVRAAINEALAAGADRAALTTAVTRNGRDPAKVGL